MFEQNDEQNIITGTTDGPGRLIRVAAEAVYLDGILNVPEGAPGLVILAHGIEDSARQSHRNVIALSDALVARGLATLQVDLFSTDERKLDEQTGFFRQNVNIMQQRLIGAAEWFLENPETEHLSIGYLGFDEVGAAALIAAVERPDIAVAVVAAGAHLNLAREYVPRVLAPTLFIASEGNEEMINANQDLLKALKTDKHFEVLPGLTNLFEDQQALEKMAQKVGDWFSRWLVSLP